MSSDTKYHLKTSSTTVYKFYPKTNKVVVSSGSKLEALDVMEPRTIILKLLYLASVRERFRTEGAVRKPILCTAFMIKFGERLKTTRTVDLESLLQSTHVRKHQKDVVRELLKDVIKGKIRAMFPQDLALDGREETFYEELPPKEVKESPETRKNGIEQSPLRTLDDDVVNDIKNLRKRKRAAEKDRDELEWEFKRLGWEIRCQLEEDVDSVESDVKILNTKIHALFEDSDDRG